MIKLFFALFLRLLIELLINLLCLGLVRTVCQHSHLPGPTGTCQTVKIGYLVIMLRKIWLFL